MGPSVLEKDLYDEDVLTKPTTTSADPTIQNQRFEIDFGKIVEPEYADRTGRLREYARPVLEKLRDYYSKAVGVATNYFGDVKMRFGKLPTTYLVFIDPRTGKEAKRLPIGKVFGQYSPETKEIIIDPVVDKNTGDPERRLLEAYFKIPEARSVIAHELSHHAHDRSGGIRSYMEKFGRKGIDMIEGIASYITEAIGYNDNAYPVQKRKIRDLVDRRGVRETVLGFV